MIPKIQQKKSIIYQCDYLVSNNGDRCRMSTQLINSQNHAGMPDMSLSGGHLEAGIGLLGIFFDL